MDKSILLVDDEEGIRKVLGILLADMGYQVHMAANGNEALRAFEKLRPPIVLTDIKMPEMDGIELLRHLKQISPETEVIMITQAAYANDRPAHWLSNNTGIPVVSLPASVDFQQGQTLEQWFEVLIDSLMKALP